MFETMRTHQAETIAISFQPLIQAITGLPFAYRATATDGDGMDFTKMLASRSPQERDRLDVARATRVVEMAAVAGIGATGAILLVPVRAACASPDAVLQQLFKAALAHRFPLDRLVVEITADERGNPELAARLAQGCADRGLAIALQDFCAGPLGLGLLARFTPDFVTLDSDLVRGIHRSDSRRQMVSSILRLARGMGVAVAARHVADREDLTTLCSLGVQHVGGDWISAPQTTLVRPCADVPPRREPRTQAVATRRIVPQPRDAWRAPNAAQPSLAC